MDSAIALDRTTFESMTDELELRRRVEANIEAVRARIADAEARAGRPSGSVTLVAVSKLQPIEAMRAAIEARCLDLGENYVQEAELKIAELKGSGMRLHLLGNLQRNKARKAAAIFDVVQSIDDPRLARALGTRAVELGKQLEVLVEVNSSGEAGKHGVPPDQTLQLCEAVSMEPGLLLNGLMTVGPLEGGLDGARRCFDGVKVLFDRLPAANRRVLSMGMSGDFETAIEAGSTMVRVGTAVFGSRRQTGWESK